MTATEHARAPARPRGQRLAGPRVGATLSVRAGDAKLSVTVTKVIDPLRGSGAAVPAGTRPVGVLVRLLNHGPRVYDSSSTVDFSLATSAGSATPLYVPSGVCQTPLRNFDNYLVAGASASGCVSFAVGTRAMVTGVRFSPHGSAAGRVSWLVG